MAKLCPEARSLGRCWVRGPSQPDYWAWMSEFRNLESSLCGSLVVVGEHLLMIQVYENRRDPYSSHFPGLQDWDLKLSLNSHRSETVSLGCQVRRWLSVAETRHQGSHLANADRCEQYGLLSKWCGVWIKWKEIHAYILYIYELERSRGFRHSLVPGLELERWWCWVDGQKWEFFSSSGVSIGGQAGCHIESEAHSVGSFYSYVLCDFSV